MRVWQHRTPNVSASHFAPVFRSHSTSESQTTKSALHFPVMKIEDVLVEPHESRFYAPMCAEGMYKMDNNGAEETWFEESGTLHALGSKVE